MKKRPGKNSQKALFDSKAFLRSLMPNIRLSGHHSSRSHSRRKSRSLKTAKPV